MNLIMINKAWLIYFETNVTLIIINHPNIKNTLRYNNNTS